MNYQVVQMISRQKGLDKDWVHLAPAQALAPNCKRKFQLETSIKGKTRREREREKRVDAVENHFNVLAAY